MKGCRMWKSAVIATTFALMLGWTSAIAQGPRGQNCLHGPDETPANRARRQQAVQFAARVNLAESRFSLPGGSPQYRSLNELPNVPAVPAGFDIQFHLDGSSYMFSLKDTRDACSYAIFTDQGGLVYEAIPGKSEPTIVPLATK